MLYNALERPHTRPSKWVDKGGRRKPRTQERDNRWEVMSFSVDHLPGFSDERGSVTPVYLADRRPLPQQPWGQPGERPVSAFDTDRRRAPLFSREGMSVRAGIGLLLAVFIVMVGVVAVSYGQITVMNREVNVTRDRIASLQEMCYNIEAEIAVHVSEINVSRSAVEMGMISARGMDVIYLTAPQTAVMSNPGTGMLTAAAGN